MASRRLPVALLGLGLGLVPATLIGAPSESVAAQTADFRSPETVSGSGLAEVDGSLIGGGPDFKVRFTPDGIRFTPALGPDCPRNFPLHTRLRSVSRGSGEVSLAGSTRTLPVRVDGQDRVDYGLGAGIKERYDVGQDGVEMSFVFAERLPGSGDLVVRLDVETDLVATRLGDVDQGLEFLWNGLAGVSIGAVTGIDAAGDTCSGDMAFDGRTLELSLPADFVDSAAYPVVLDPLVAPVVTVASAYDESDPDVAYDETNDLFLVVWERRFSASNVDIRGQRVDITGSPIGGLIYIEADPGTVASDPSVANVNQRDRFVVVWHENLDINCCSVNAADGAVGPDVKAAASKNVEIYADIGGDSTLTDDDAVLVWSDYTAQKLMASQVMVNLDGSVSPSVPKTLLTGTQYFWTRISKSGSSNGRYLITMDRDNGPTNSIDGMIITKDLGVITLDFPITYGAKSEIKADNDGDGTHWLVAYQQEQSPTDFDVKARQVTWNKVTAVASVSSEIDIETGVNDNEIDPHVGWLGQSFIVTYRDEATGSAYDAWLQSCDLITGQPIEDRELIAALNNDESSIQIATRRGASTGTPEDALIVWERMNTTTYDGDIKAIGFEAEDGVMIDLGGGCGSGGGVAYATCAKTAGWHFVHRLEAAKPNALAWLVLSFDRIDAKCGSCVLVPNPFSGFTIGNKTTDAAGNAQLPMIIPDEPALIGLKFYDQWLVQKTKASCADLSVDLSNALQVEIE